MPTQKKEKTSMTERPPIIVVMGHIDHGKSTLLDYIRESNVVAQEAGGITQHTYAYEIAKTNDEGAEKKMTFLDTPGHEAFTLMRSRGAAIADIAILVVAADDGIKAQTKEALAIIKETGIPYIVAINKTDLPNANIEKVKQELMEHEVYLEGYGGDIPFAAISAKSGEGIPELINLLFLVAELEEMKGNPEGGASGVVIESHRDPKTGVSATLLITAGTITKGMHVAAGESLSPVRRIDDFKGDAIEEATFSSPIRITGFNSVPKVGATFATFVSKKEAETYVTETKDIEDKPAITTPPITDKNERHVRIPVIIKADMEGTLEAVEHEIAKITIENLSVDIVERGVGAISESDIKRAAGAENPFVIGFNVPVEKTATQLADQLAIPVETFTIIYRLAEWLKEELTKRRPTIKSEETIGRAKIIRIFSTTKNKQVIGGKVKEGKIALGAKVKVLRRDHEIGHGKIVELQQQKASTKEVNEGDEFGVMIESKAEIAEGDYIEAFVVVEK